MNIRVIISVCMAGALLVSFAGCKKENAETTRSEVKSATDKTVDAVKDAAANVKEGAEKAATEVKEGAQKAATEVKEGAEKVASEVKEKAVEVKDKVAEATAPSADDIIAKAKGQVAEGKYQDALTTLGGLSNLTLSDVQKQAVDALKEQIQKGIASGASALNNLAK